MNLLDMIERALDGGNLLVTMGAILLFAVLIHVLFVVIRKMTHAAVSTSYLRHQKTLSFVSLCYKCGRLCAVPFCVRTDSPRTWRIAYLASASVIALAVGFGAIGIVQDVVMG
ncbi:MAG: hypothetical protein ACI8Z1_002380 [Candidatus Azotimanducaceae bacterium]|jgi:hypothetical protein